MIIKTAIFQGSSTDVSRKPKLKAPEYAFIGRSNVGKSSLINMLCGRKDLAKTSSMPGKTILVNHFLINGKWYLVDLPGYGFAKASKKAQATLKAMIEDYVSHSEELARLFILLDSRHELQEIDRSFITAVAGAGIPFTVIPRLIRETHRQGGHPGRDRRRPEGSSGRNNRRQTIKY